MFYNIFYFVLFISEESQSLIISYMTTLDEAINSISIRIQMRSDW